MSFINRFFLFAILFGLTFLAGADISFAADFEGTDVDDIAENIVVSAERLPGLITAVSYLLALMFGIAAVLKGKEHVENPTQTPLRQAAIRAIAAGSLFGLPIVYEAMESAIGGGGSFGISNNDSPLGIFSTISTGLSLFIPTANFNAVLVNIIESIENLPGIISAFAYLMGLLLGVMGILKIKEHVDNPQTPLREGVIRLIIGGAFFAIPTIYAAMATAIEGDELGLIGNISSALGALSSIFSSGTSNLECNPTTIPVIGSFLVGQEIDGQTIGGASVGNVVCNISGSAGALPNFLFALGYIIGLVFGFWGLLKIRDHVLNPTQVQMSEGITRLLAGGAFFSLPLLVEVARNSIAPESLTAVSTISNTTGFNENTQAGGGSLLDVAGSLFSGDFSGALTAGLSFFGIGGGSCAGDGGLDVKLVCFMSDIFGPVQTVLNFFGLVAGIILIMIGVSRWIKSTQEGSKGPLGLGTLMTFLAGGALISFNALLSAFSTSFFQNPVTYTFASLQYREGLLDHEVDHIHNVISAVTKFVLLIGLISFVRGIIIVRDVAEGKQQASMMAGVTHMVGGALAFNLGPLLNSIQTSLGITGVGILFN